MIAFLSAILAFQLNSSMLSPALVTMARELHASDDAVAATQSAFFTSAALFSIFMPRLGDLIGRRRVLVGMLTVMAFGSVVAALSPNVAILFVGRLLQGISGPIIPICLVILRDLVPSPKRYGLLMGIVAAVNGGIAGVDALLGGHLAVNYGYPSLFWTMALVAVVAATLTRLLTPESTAAQRPRMDWAGSALFVLSIGSLLVSVNEFGDMPIGLLVLLVVVSLGSFAVLWRTEARSPHPLVSTAQLKERATWAVVGTAFLTLAGVFAVMNGVVPALAQDRAVGLGFTAEEVSWWMLAPYAIAGLIVGPLSGRLAASLGYRLMLRVGIVGSVVALAIFVLTLGGVSRGAILLLSIAVGVTYAGMANIMLNGLGVVLSPSVRPGSLPGLNTAGFNLGAGFSFIVIYAAQTAFASGGSNPRGGYAAALLVGAIILLGAFALSFFIPRPAEAEERRVREGAVPARS
ncbi:MFS transporter [Pseudonocardia spinosispora]|uniref:MFS transporter n=1 Tax=Pseudonocardia spinosispora TaxID=103441 RepID=UPI000406C665|nr:MFS transporter [Pseudonocardia spinosispora]